MPSRFSTPVRCDAVTLLLACADQVSTGRITSTASTNAASVKFLHDVMSSCCVLACILQQAWRITWRSAESIRYVSSLSTYSTTSTGCFRRPLPSAFKACTCISMQDWHHIRQQQSLMPCYISIAALAVSQYANVPRQDVYAAGVARCPMCICVDLVAQAS